MTWDFWQEQAKKAVSKTLTPYLPRPANEPWWADPRPQNPQPGQYPQQGSASMTVHTMDGQVINLTGEAAEIADASTEHAEAYRKSTDKCPRCRGNNYAVLGKVVSQLGSFENKQCFDCGYPIEHNGVPPSIGNTVTGRARMARQTDAGGRTVNNYNPKSTAHQYM